MRTSCGVGGNHVGRECDAKSRVLMFSKSCSNSENEGRWEGWKCWTGRQHDVARKTVVEEEKYGRSVDNVLHHNDGADTR